MEQVKGQDGTLGIESHGVADRIQECVEMSPIFHDTALTIHYGDVFEALRTLPEIGAP